MKKLTAAILSLLALTLTGCGNDNRYVKVVDRYTIYTDTIRGHVYLHVYGGGILHDPDCPCHTQNDENIK